MAQPFNCLCVAVNFFLFLRLNMLRCLMSERHCRLGNVHMPACVDVIGSLWFCLKFGAIRALYARHVWLCGMQVGITSA